MNKKNNSKRSVSTFRIVILIWSHITLKRKTQLLILLLTMLLSGLAEVFSLASIIPLLSLLSSPESIWNLPFITTIAGIFGLTNAYQFLLPATILFSLCAILSGIIRVTNLFLSTKLSALIGSDLSSEIFLRNLYQPYKVHINRNSSDVLATATTHITSTISVVNLLTNLTTSFIISVFIYDSIKNDITC